MDEPKKGDTRYMEYGIRKEIFKKFSVTDTAAKKLFAFSLGRYVLQLDMLRMIYCIGNYLSIKAPPATLIARRRKKSF